VGRLAHALPQQRAAQRTERCEADRNTTSSGGPAADVTPSEPKVSDWRGGRAAASTSKNFSGPASGMAGDRGDDLAGVQRTKRSGVNGTPGSSSSGPRSCTREGNKARDPRARERAAVRRHPARQRARRVAASPREGWRPEGARRWAFDSDSTRSATARPRAAGARPAPSGDNALDLRSDPPRLKSTERRRAASHLLAEQLAREVPSLGSAGSTTRPFTSA
jgi:hypothetical protein